MRRLGRLYHGAVLLAHDEDRELGDGPHVVGVQAGVVELAAQIGVAVLEELGALRGLRVNLDVDLRERLTGLGVADLQAGSPLPLRGSGR